MKKIRLSRNKILAIVLSVLIITIIVMGSALVVRKCSSGTSAPSGSIEQTDGLRRLEDILLGSGGNMLYGLSADDFDITEGEIGKGETFSKLLNGRFNLNITIVNKLVEKSKKVFDLRNMKAGNSYTAFLVTEPDSTQTLRYLAYDKNQTEYVMFDCSVENPSVKVVKRDVVVTERYAEGVINSSLSATIAEGNLPIQLEDKLSNSIYQWSIDFHFLHKGDRFRVLYEEYMVDTVCVGVGKIYGAEFVHADKSYWAINFEQGDEKGYWDKDGVNLRKAFLISPLQYKARVSSKFGLRTHPITRKRGTQHNGVDYACPTGTPVRAVANGKVIYKGWDSGGGGNTIKIQHDQGLVSGYLHLSRFATGIGVGSRVSQEQLIGYVGSTGMSTGPHLDFRIQKNGKYVDPTKMQSLPSKPIDGKYKAAFNVMKTDVMKVMDEYATTYKR